MRRRSTSARGFWSARTRPRPNLPLRSCEPKSRRVEKPECTSGVYRTGRRRRRAAAGTTPKPHNREYGWDGVEWELPKLNSPASLRGPGDYYLEMVIHAGWRWTTTTGIEKVIPENEVGNEARILADDEVGPGVGGFRCPTDGCAPAPRSTAKPEAILPLNFWPCRS